MPVLAIETSCDETATAIIGEEYQVLAERVFSQIEAHKEYGGVVPEVASREHLERLSSLVEAVMDEADVIPASVAFTAGPGLIGSLLVGASFAKSFAWARGIPAIPVHHIAGHLGAVWLEKPDFQSPFLALVVSGGHTELNVVHEDRSIEHFSRTVDDAAGEAFDKAARMLSAGYPGGPAIEKLAEMYEGVYEVLVDSIMPGKRAFSFSGLKTALRVRISDVDEELSDESRARWAAAFQNTVIRSLIRKTEEALDATGLKRLILVGGVAANSALRRAMESMSNERGIELAMPRMKYCTDNAAMIGAAAIAFPSLPASLDFSASASLPLISEH